MDIIAAHAMDLRIQNVDMSPARITGGLLLPMTVRAFTKLSAASQGKLMIIRSTSCKGM